MTDNERWLAPDFFVSLHVERQIGPRCSQVLDRGIGDARTIRDAEHPQRGDRGDE